MPLFLEAELLLFPPDAGGRTSPVAPREGSYRPFARFDGRVSRALLLEGPPRLSPGDAARVMLELEDDIAAGSLRDGAQLELLEHDDRVVGAVTVIRVCGRASHV